MTTPKRHLLLISHGADAYAMEAAYAILCARANGGFSGPIHVVTDHAHRLRQLTADAPDVNYLHLDEGLKNLSSVHLVMCTDSSHKPFHGLRGSSRTTMI
jgi:hypothetical protein